MCLRFAAATVRQLAALLLLFAAYLKKLKVPPEGNRKCMLYRRVSETISVFGGGGFVRGGRSCFSGQSLSLCGKSIYNNERKSSFYRSCLPT